MHPIHFDADYEMERNRLTVFFRLLVAIPWIVVAYLWGVLAYIGAVISWFAMMFTGRHPEGLYDFLASFLRFSARTSAFVLLITDEWPSFSGKPEDSYPVRVDIDPPQESYSRAKTFFKLVLYFPQYLIGSAVSGVVAAAWVIAWWRVLFTGKQSATMHDALRVGLAYYIRSTGFLFLLTEVHPRLLDLPPQEYPADAPALPQPHARIGSGGGEERLIPRPETPAAEPGTAQPPQPPSPPRT